MCAVALAFFPIRRHVDLWMFGGVFVFVFGTATPTLGWGTSFGVAMSALVLLGAGDMVSVYIRHTLIQCETPDAIRGRVSAIFIGASNELGEFESGLSAGWFALVPAIIFGGARGAMKHSTPSFLTMGNILKRSNIYRCVRFKLARIGLRQGVPNTPSWRESIDTCRRGLRPTTF